MDFANFLREKHEATAALYQAHHALVLELQEALHRDTLPLVAKQLALDEDSLHRAKEWIDDEGSIFRMLKKHSFRAADACAALDETLRWRMTVLAPLQTAHSAPFVRCLPADARDMAGRPVLLIQLAELPGAPEEAKQDILRAYDTIRQRLRETRGCAVFQCLFMIDFKGANVRSMAADAELVPWFIREVAPRFPGMCAGVLMVNYSWAYAGMYNFIKRLLPSSVLERISFPTLPELLAHFEPSHLPREYGGGLDLSPPPGPDFLTNSIPPPPQLPADQRHHSPAPQNITLAAYLPSTSLLNPFYGYPTVSKPGSSVPQLKNGRRRKRDLARTLALLWLAKLKRTADRTWLWIVMTLVLWVAGLRR